MDKNPLVTSLNKAVPGAVLEVRRFGRSSITSIWVEAQAIQQVGLFLKENPEYQLDWLENLSMVEFEDIFVLTYFLRSTVTSQILLLRVSIVPDSPNAQVDAPSIVKIWPMGQLMEKDIAEMFGVRFTPVEKSDSSTILPEDWKGYPLRKNYVFPKEFLNISHSRSDKDRFKKESP